MRKWEWNKVKALSHTKPQYNWHSYVGSPYTPILIQILVTVMKISIVFINYNFQKSNIRSTLATKFIYFEFEKNHQFLNDDYGFSIRLTVT